MAPTVHDRHAMDEPTEGLSDVRAEAMRATWQDRTLEALLRHIETRYHVSQKRVSAALVAALDAVLPRPPPELEPLRVGLRHLRTLMTVDLPAHIRDEEEDLFPLIRDLERRAATEEDAPGEAFRARCADALARVQTQHSQIMDTLVDLRAWNVFYRLPESADPRVETLRATLVAFLDDFPEHVFLEDGVLLPRARALAESAGSDPDASPHRFAS